MPLERHDLAPARRRLDLRQQIIGHQLLTVAQILAVQMNVTLVRIIVLGALRLVVGQRALVRVRYLDLLIGDGDP